MGIAKKKYYFSHLVLIATICFYLTDLLMNFRLSRLLSLQPALFDNEIQVWRIITFPLASDTIAGIILFLITFFIFAPRIEKLFHAFLYPLILLLIVFLQGSIFTLVLWKSPIIIAGMEGLSFFIITIFTLQNIKKKLVIVNRYYLPALVFTMMMIFSWFTTLFIQSVLVSDYYIMLEGIYSSIFGITAGMIIYLQLRYLDRIQFQNEQYLMNRFSEIRTNRSGDESYALIAKKEYKRFNEELRNKLGVEDNSIPFTEENLNEILDKINTTGKESLTKNEQDFLDQYSNFL